MLSLLAEHQIDLVVLAGYLSTFPSAVTRRYRGRILNVHPALLPAFGGSGMYGMRVHQAVLDAGVRMTGATVHFVDEAYDHGPIIAQWPVPVLAGDTPACWPRASSVSSTASIPVRSQRSPAGVSLDAGGTVLGRPHPGAQRCFDFRRGTRTVMSDVRARMSS